MSARHVNTRRLGDTTTQRSVADVRGRSAALERRFAYPVLLATLLVIPQLLLEEAGVTGTWGTVSTLLDWAIWLTFLAEVVTLFAVAADRRAWARHHVIDIAIVALTPPVGAGVLASIRLLRLLRLVRLLRLAPLVRGVFSINSLVYAALLAVTTMFAGGIAFAEVEPDTSSKDGIYWALTTMTTVGYGDLTPTTDAGRLVAGIVMLVGIGFVATLTAAIADRLIVAGGTARPGSVHGLAERLDRIEAQLAQLAATGPATDRAEPFTEGRRPREEAEAAPTGRFARDEPAVPADVTHTDSQHDG